MYLEWWVHRYLESIFLKKKKKLKLDMWHKIKQQLESNLESNRIFS